MSTKLQRYLPIAFVISLVVWGVYSLAAYLAVQLHAVVLVNDTTVQQLTQLCSNGGLLCRGLYTAPATLTFFWTRLEPLRWFLFFSALFYGCFLFYRALQTGEWNVRGALRPWHLPLVFLVTVWLLFLTLSRTLGTDQNPMRVLYEPLPQVYVGVAPSELKVLQDNYDRLMDRGCLTVLGKTSHGATVTRVKELCVQASFITRVLPPLLFLLLLTLESLLLGSALLRLGRVSIEKTGIRFLLSVAAGMGAFIILLWTLAQVSLYTTTFGWALFVAIPLLCFREVKAWFLELRDASVEVDLPWWSGRIALLWALFSLLALNFLYVIRPFPIGWDDLGRYLNQPRLLVSYGESIPTMGTFQWEYLTSLGFLLFGYDSTLGATIALQINWLAGLLAVATVYAVGRVIFGQGGGILSALLYYVTPVIQHFSFADMKTDNAVFAMGTIGLLCALLGLYPRFGDDEELEHSGHRRFYFFLAGAFLGLAFGLKATAVMVAMAIGMLLLRNAFKSWGLSGAAILTFAVFVFQGNLNIAKFSERVFGDPGVLSKSVTLSLFVIIGFGLIVAGALRHRAAIKPVLVQIGLFFLGFLVLVLPWMAGNSWRAGYVLPRLLFSPPNELGTTFETSEEAPPVQAEGRNIRYLPSELKVDPSNAACVSSGGVEELDRYWGYGKGISHYLTLPWRAVMDTDSPGYYVTELPGFLLFPLLLLLPILWTRRGQGMRALFWATALLVVQWVFLANGVPWYGVGMFLGLCLAMEAMVRFAPSKEDVSPAWASKRGLPPPAAIAWFFVIFSLVIGFSMRFWILDQQRSLFEYAMGKVSSEVLRERTIPHYDDVRDIILARAKEMPKSPYVYRMGTFIPYFIPKNLELLPVADNQLDMFNCINQERDHALTLKRLQALGFNSMIFDTNTATIERDLQGSLHKKVDALLEFLNDSTLGLTPVVNDNTAGMVFVLFPAQ